MNKDKNKFPLFVLIYVITVTAVNAVLYAPALPKLTKIMNISASQAEYTIAFFLVGYASAQIVFGLSANFFGRRKSLLIGLCLGVAASILCIVAVFTKNYHALLMGRFLVGLGTASGLIITYAVVNDSFSGNRARKVTSYIVMAFAVAPGAANLIGGFLTMLNPVSCFIFLFIYNTTALVMIICTPNIKEHEGKTENQKTMISEFIKTFLNFNIIIPSLIYGCFTGILYSIVALAPFIAIQKMNINSALFGILFFFSYLGYLTGSYLNTLFSDKISSSKSILIGMIAAFSGEFLIFGINMLGFLSPVAFFICIFIIMFSMPFIFVNTSVIAVSSHSNKSNASSVLNTFNVGTACLAVFICGQVKENYLINMIYILTSLAAVALIIFIISYSGIKEILFQAKKSNDA